MFSQIVTALVLTLVSSVAIAAPATADKNKAPALPFHFPKSMGEHLPFNAESNSLRSFTSEESTKIGLKYLMTKLNLSSDSFKIYNNFTDHAGITHVYGAHVIKGARIANHQAAVHVYKGQVTSYSASFGTSSHFAKEKLSIAAPKTQVSFEQVSATAAAQYGIPVYKKFASTFEYVELSDGKVVYAFKFQLRDNPLTQWLQVWSDAATGKVVQVVDFGSKASYKVIPVPKINADDGFSLVKNPEFKASSPNGWSDGTSTSGNNINAVSFISGRAAGTGNNGVFDSNFNANADPTDAENVQASAVNLFYIGNLMHDITYQYGFTEAAGNFQNDNFGKGGRDGDAVILTVQSQEKFNNANFFTPSDGQNGEMNMFIFTKTNPRRDGGLDNTIPLHEYGHGLSSRLTGGSATSQCLRTLESGGMGEGWSDIVAMIVTAKQANTPTTPIVLGDYVTNRPEGIRSHPYSTDTNVNPLTYADLQTRDEVHDIGEVWATALWEVYWNLVTKSGFSANLHDAKNAAGNIVALQNVIGGMMIQPCNPTFLDARDAIIASDAARYNGANKCEIWRGFSKRGMGPNARNHQNDFSVPAECKDGAVPSSPAPVPAPAPIPSKTTANPNPRKTTNPGPKRTGRPKPKRTGRPKPKRTGRPKPKRTGRPKPKRTRKPKRTNRPRPGRPEPGQCDPNNICCLFIGINC
ncbi:hypothetical protein QVD99_007896 [Batrachochytrium dendrobatidis]|nr:hypothetical protein O5D80_001553 [Batrachochytrium dendrobatidis]KAK5665550.1 hypothetical protein QVD99_007896 [Batrachochytrium dendrobatidis]